MTNAVSFLNNSCNMVRPAAAGWHQAEAAAVAAGHGGSRAGRQQHENCVQQCWGPVGLQASGSCQQQVASVAMQCSVATGPLETGCCVLVLCVLVYLQIHGYVCMAAVVVTDTLDWKLHGFDLTSEHALTGGAGGCGSSGSCGSSDSWSVASTAQPTAHTAVPAGVRGSAKKPQHQLLMRL